MKKFFAKISTAVALFCLFASGIHPSGIYQNKAQASENFQTDLTTTYRVEANGTTHVKHDFKITNKTPTTFIKQYALTTGYPEITNVVVNENGNPLKPNVVTTDTQTSIAFDFPSDVVGEGKNRQFSVSYSNTDLATVGGKVLEIHVPALRNPELYDSHRVILQTPIDFGESVRVSPNPIKIVNTGNLKETIFENVADQSISAYFGSEQYYNLTLRYNLQNPGSSAGLVQVALPPETSFQELFYHGIDPAPENIELDEDGNWIATFRVPANNTQPVFVTAVAKTTLEPNNRVPIVSPANKHTAQTNFWQLGGSDLPAEYPNLNTPEQIYDFVVEKLNYQTGALDDIPPRLGASEALKNPNLAVCQEFSDVFIALSRAKEIPARRLTGYAYSQNDQLRPVGLVADVLHAWPEYFDQTKNLWIPVDPTWEDTTGGIDYFSQFDLNHIVFAINGISSQTPYPAGSYKLENQDTRDIEVGFTGSFPSANPDFKVWTTPSKVFGMPLPGFYQLHVANQSGQAWYNVSVASTVDNPNIKLKPIEIGTILPFTVKKIPLVLNTTGFQITNNNSVIINFNQQNNDQKLYTSQLSGLTAGPAILGAITEPKILVGLAVFSTLGILIAGSLLVFRRKKPRSVRRKS